MKGKLNRDVSISDNEMLLAGTHVDILDVLNECTGILYQCKLITGRQVKISSNKVDITDYSPHIDWEQRRYELAKAAMQGIFSDKDEVDIAYTCMGYKESEKHTVPKAVAQYAVSCADALIEELKKED